MNRSALFKPLAAALALCFTMLAAHTTAQPTDSAQPAPADSDSGNALSRRVLSSLAGVYAADSNALRIASIPCDDSSICLYLELTETGGELAPKRQEVWSIRAEGADRASVTIFAFPVRRLERYMPSLADVAIGLWAAPERFPAIRLDELIPMGVAKLQFDSPSTATLTTPDALIFHRGDVRSVTRTIRWSDSLTFTEARLDAQGATVDMLDLTLPGATEQTPITITPDGLVIIDLRIGRGVPLEAGDSALVDFTIQRANGQLVDSTFLPDRKSHMISPAPGNSIAAFRAGLLGMTAEESAARPGKASLRRIVSPPALAFGDRGSPPIVGPNELLILDIELVTLKDNTK